MAYRSITNFSKGTPGQGQVLAYSDNSPQWTTLTEPVIVTYTQKDLARILSGGGGDIRMDVFKAYLGLLRQIIPSLCKGDMIRFEDKDHKDIEQFAAVLATSWQRHLTTLLDARFYIDGTFELVTKVT